MPEAVNILIVERDAAVRSAIREALEGWRVKFHEAPDPKRALEMFQAAPTQVVLVELEEPRAGGIEFSRAVSREFPNVLIAVMMAHVSQTVMSDCLKAGASDFLMKPIDPQALRLVVSRFVDLVERRRDKLFTPGCLDVAVVELKLRSSARSIPPAVSSVVELIRGFVTHRELQRIELALSEVLRNAYEHGNLGISFEEKAQVCEAGSFEELVSKRSEFAQEQRRCIYLRAKLSGATLVLQVEDEGDGFDWRAMLARNPCDSLLNLNGRGLLLIARTFDSLEYNEKGNIITLTKTLL